MPKPEKMSRSKWKRVKRILNRKKAWDKAVRDTCGYRRRPIDNIIGYAPKKCKACHLNKECRNDLYLAVQRKIHLDLPLDVHKVLLDKAVKIIDEEKKKDELKKAVKEAESDLA